MNATGERVETTPELLADIEAKASAATPGEWACWNGWGSHDSLMRAERIGPVNGGGICASCARGGDVAGSRADLEHVATACPSVVLALVARIRELESEREAFTPEMVESIDECIGAGIWCSTHGDPVDTDGADAARSLIESILLKRP